MKRLRTNAFAWLLLYGCILLGERCAWAVRKKTTDPSQEPGCENSFKKPYDQGDISFVREILGNGGDKTARQILSAIAARMDFPPDPPNPSIKDKVATFYATIDASDHATSEAERLQLIGGAVSIFSNPCLYIRVGSGETPVERRWTEVDTPEGREWENIPYPQVEKDPAYFTPAAIELFYRDIRSIRGRHTIVEYVSWKSLVVVTGTFVHRQDLESPAPFEDIDFLDVWYFEGDKASQRYSFLPKRGV